MKKWFKAQNLWGYAFDALTAEETGTVVKAIWTYTRTGEIVPLEGMLKGLFSMILADLEREEEKARRISAKRAMAGAAGGRKKAANRAKAFAGKDAADYEEDCGDGANAANATFDDQAEDDEANAEDGAEDGYDDEDDCSEEANEAIASAYDDENEYDDAANEAFASDFGDEGDRYGAVSVANATFDYIREDQEEEREREREKEPKREIERERRETERETEKEKDITPQKEKEKGPPFRTGGPETGTKAKPTDHRAAISGWGDSREEGPRDYGIRAGPESQSGAHSTKTQFSWASQ